MEYYNFIASDDFSPKDLQDINRFIHTFNDVQTVTLKDENQLKLLLNLIGVENNQEYETSGIYFSKYWDLSSSEFSEFNEDEFNLFYKKWISITKREDNMDEYGNLIFLQGIAKKWNTMKHRLVVKESI